MARGKVKAAVALLLTAAITTAAASESALLRALGDFGDALARSTQVVARLTERVAGYDGATSNVLVRRAAATAARAASQELDKALDDARDRERPLSVFAEQARAGKGDAATRGEDWSRAVGELRAGTSRLGEAVERVAQAPAMGTFLGGKTEEAHAAGKVSSVIGALERSEPPATEPELGAVDVAATRYRELYAGTRQLSDALRDKVHDLTGARRKE